MLTMTRAELKKMFGHYRPSLIRPEMLETVSEQKLATLRESLRLRYERSMSGLYADKGLNDEQRWLKYREISTLDTQAREKLEPLERRCNLIAQRRLLAILKWTQTDPAASRRRVAA